MMYRDSDIDSSSDNESNKSDWDCLINKLLNK